MHGEFVEVLHAGRTFHTALGLDEDDTVGAARTVDGCGRTILEHGDFLDILGVDGQEVGELFLSGVGEVERLVDVALVGDVVEHDERLGVGVD